ncbi:MAG: Crp/Fnr family transcriptional regulator [Bacteroidetes bacterium RIFCSPLOWO2_12_FULL_35_15]|nr:MAG: Crp/Fnr family transcriptional regulator [Bacteroidetes bacterium RIFCSPLOWO2_12_FULL_35_15]
MDNTTTLGSNTQMDAALRNELISLGTVKEMEAGCTMLSENSYIKNIPIVLSGSVKVMREDEDGREILLYYIKPGETCIMSVLGGINNETSKIKAIVEDKAEILMIPIEKANLLVQKFPAWNEFVLRLYNKRFEELLSVINAIAFQKIDQRILELLEKKRELSGNNEINITHQQLADELGTAREVVSRLLKQLERDKKITLSRNKITILALV